MSTMTIPISYITELLYDGWAERRDSNARGKQARRTQAGGQAGRQAGGHWEKYDPPPIHRFSELEKLGEPEPAIKGGDRKLETQYSI